jgi:SAM-dependent methyltransferase
MNERLAELLVDPDSKRPLRLVDTRREGDEVVEGVMAATDAGSYSIVGGIPRFVTDDDPGQLQTRDSFGYKWSRRESFDSPRVLETLSAWLVRRYGFTDRKAMCDYFRGRELILDAGCGAGFSSSLYLSTPWEGGDWIGVDISTAVDVARERLGCDPKIHFVQANLMRLPFRLGTFDTVFSEGVLHHTASTRSALAAVASMLRPGGELLFYVYLRKAPAREFVDDDIRDAIAELSPEEAWDSLRSLTRLGQALAELEVTVEVPEDVPLLGIRSGRYDVQRLIYYHFAKLFWDPERSFEQNVHVNFDWYRPRYAHRQSPEEVRGWCAELGLEISHFDVDPSGITVRALRAGA